MRSGENEIKVSTWSGTKEPINPHARIKVDLMVNDFSNLDHSYLVANIDYKNSALEGENVVKGSSKSGYFSSTDGFSESENGDVSIGPIDESKTKNNVVWLKRKINIPSSLPLWAFFDSDSLPDYDAMSDEVYYQEMATLFPYYQRLQDAISNNDIDSVMPMFEERNRELDAAFYNSPGTLERKLRDVLNSAANDDSAELARLVPLIVNFSVQDNNVLASLSRGQGDAAVGLNYKEHTGSYSFDMIFRKKDGEWILTR